MTEKRFEIVGENFTNVDVATYIVEYGDGDDDCFELYESKEDSQKVCDKLNNILDENEQLKQQVNHLKMYKNLFREFQKQLDGVKKKSDLDHKDFDDLMELAKGHVFDDEHGWIWLPVNDR